MLGIPILFLSFFATDFKELGLRIIISQGLILKRFLQVIEA